MYPDLFSIGPIHTFGIFVTASFLLGILMALELGKSEGISPPQVIDISLVIIVSSLIGARLANVIFNISYYSDHPVEALRIWDGGLVFSGGVFLAIIVTAFYVRTHNITIWRAGDLWAPAVAFGQGIGWIGCFFVGCGYGKMMYLPWAVVFKDPESLAPVLVPLHPTQLYASMSGFIIFLIVLLIRSKRKFEGQVFLWMLILDSTAKLLIERFRGDSRGLLISGDMTATQLISLIIMVASVISLWHLRSSSCRDKN